MSPLKRLKQRMADWSIQPKRALGQNFLVSHSAIERIVSQAAGMHPKGVIEIGPGLGALTERLAELGVPLTLLELDRTLAARWKELGYQVLEGDALQADWTQLLKEHDVLVSNLPYQISSSIVIERSLDDSPLRGMILMFQKEVAQRLLAREQSSDYGLLTVMAQTYWSVRSICKLSPRDFYPPPQIASQVLQFERIDEIPAFLEHRGQFLGFLKKAFRQRRKLLASNLADPGAAWSKEDLQVLFTQLGLDPQVRAEVLSVEMFHKLYFNLIQGNSQ